MLRAYGDESYDAAQERVCAIGALVGRESDWQALETQWLARTGGRVFHAADCESDHGEFAGLPHADNQRLYRDLTTLIVESRLFGYAHAMDLIAYDELFPDVLPDSSYFWTFHKVIGDCARNGALSLPQERVHFTFDRRASEHNIRQMYDLIRSTDWKYRAFVEDDIAFGSRELVGIQAADLFVREVMKELDSRVGRGRPTRLSFMALLRTRRIKVRCYSREYYESVREEITKQDADPASLLSRQEYGNWLNEHRVLDTHDSRLRYLAFVDETERQQQLANVIEPA